ncbi:hypothetical protein ACO0QE_001967 [Hanseniaspora vineae]
MNAVQKYLQKQEITDETSPTLLEIISALEFENLINPTCHYLSTLVLYKFHNKLLFTIHNNLNEILLAVETLYNYKLLSTENSTFIKSNYGYQYGNLDDLPKLSTKQKLVILGENYVLNYIWAKCDALYEQKTKHLQSQRAVIERERMLSGDHGGLTVEDDYIILKTRDLLFIKYYPLVKRCYRLSNFVFKMLYLKKTTGSLTLLQAISGIKMFRMPDEEDAEETDFTGTSLPASVSRKTHANPWSAIVRLAQRLKYHLAAYAGSSSRWFSVMLYLIKIIQYYNSTELIQNIKNRLTDISTIPPPPGPPASIEKKSNKTENRTSEQHFTSEKQGYESSDVCKLCHKTIVNPAMLETGYVFCYSCIVQYYKDAESALEETEKGEKQEWHRTIYCPVSGAPLLHDIHTSIRRLLF